MSAAFAGARGSPSAPWGGAVNGTPAAGPWVLGGIRADNRGLAQRTNPVPLSRPRRYAAAVSGDLRRCCWKRKTPARTGSGRGKFGGLVREGVIHETLAR